MVVVGADPLYAEHDTGRGHPERAQRLDAVVRGLADAGLGADTPRLEVRHATRAELERVHPAPYLDRLERICAAGGGALDPDTVVSARSWDAAAAAAGAGLAAIDALGAGDASAAFLAVRPPGHHAVPAAAMGFCLLNNVAVTAAALRARGDRVLVVDWDAHHGNGTQDIFWDDPGVLYVSMHEWPLYPGTGRLHETGGTHAPRTTINFPFPAGTTGDAYLAAIDTVVAPVAEGFRPDWVLVSAGYDAHRADPLTGLGLSAGDFGDLTRRVLDLAPRPGRVILFLEGGYDLDALRASVAATAVALLGEGAGAGERSTAGGAGMPVVGAARDLWLDGVA